MLGIYCPNLMAQSDVDALRFSQTNPLGSTARSMATGGAFGAVGADLSNITLNPAGLAQAKTGAFGISAAMISGTNNANYYSTSTKGITTLMQIPSVNLLITNRKTEKGIPKKTGWVNTNFQIGFNRVADYNREMKFKGNNTAHSYTNAVANRVNNLGLTKEQLTSEADPFTNGFDYYENMFWEAQLIDFDEPSKSYYAYYYNDEPNFEQNSRVFTKGGMNEISGAYAANYSNKFLIGAAINIITLNYKEDNRFSERDNSGAMDNWTNYDFIRALETSGTGVSGRLGVIFTPTSNIRAGLNVETPRVLSLTDKYSDKLNVRYDNGNLVNYFTVDNTFTYKVTTPAKYNLQGAYIFPKIGFLSMEVGAQNFSLMSLSADEVGYDVANENIQEKYGTALQFKVGGEYVYNEFRLRGGFAHQGSPLLDDKTFNRQFITSGVGFNDKKWAFDLAYIRAISGDTYVPYQINKAPIVTNKNLHNQLVFSITAKF